VELRHGRGELKFGVLVSAFAEWAVVKSLFFEAVIEHSPYGEYFFRQIEDQRVLFFHGGWGKVAAAASTQYVIDNFHPAYLINIGTCGGVEGRIDRFEVVVPDKLVIYDIYEAMFDGPDDGVQYYITHLTVPDRFPTPAVRTTLYSADRDLTPRMLAEIEPLYHPTAVDWESGAIAWVAKRNGTPVLIMRGVSDLVGLEKGEAEGNPLVFIENTNRMMPVLVENLPAWMRALAPPDHC
jgi:adenosylhomocysteine nucleosidase